MSTTEDLVISRRTAVAGAGVAAAAVALAACGSSDSGSSSETTSAAAQEPSPAPAGSSAQVIGQVNDVPVGGGAILSGVVVTQASAGSFAGFSNVCTHQGCKVNSVSGGQIHCPCHGSAFNLDGSVANGPASRPLDPVAVAVDGNSIVLA